MTSTRWERIKDTFNAALAVPMAERGALVERLCAGDAELRREVESLLSARTLSIVRTAGAAAAVAAMSTTGPSDPYAQSRVGTMIGRYKLLQIIGEGGFGTVYMAEQTEPVRRRVALKIIKPGMDSKAIIARFEAERQALALMDHPHIARVLDGGVTPLAGVGAAAADGGPGERGPATGERGHAPGGGGGLPYFVMEYVIGDPITTFADAHALSIADRLTVFRQVCSAVQHAHTKGIIHRDLKPGNVLVSMVDGKPFAKVIDFGIAKATAQPLTDKTLFTEHKMLIGTPEYMSPEQAEGSLDIDTRTDVYALGVLLYELLTGVTPFDGQRLRSAAFDEMRRIIRDEEPPMPSVRMTRPAGGLARAGTNAGTSAGRDAPVSGAATAQGNGAPRATGGPRADEGETRGPRTGDATPSVARGTGVSATRLWHDATQVRGELDWIVMKALEKDRARRYETPNQLAADVQRHLAGEAVVAAPPSRAYRVRKFVRRNKGAVVTSAAIAGTLLVGIAGTTWGLVHARQAESRERATAVEAVRARDALKAQIQSIQGVYDTVAREIEVAARQGVFPADQPIDPASLPNARGMDPALARLETMRAYSVEWIRRAVRTHKEVQAQRDEAQWSAYTANLALAQGAIAAGNMPEARRLADRLPTPKISWEGVLVRRWTDAILWVELSGWSDLMFSSDGQGLLLWSDAEPGGSLLSEWDSTTGRVRVPRSAVPPVDVRLLVAEDGSLRTSVVQRRDYTQRMSATERWLAYRVTGGDSWIVAVNGDATTIAWFGIDDSDGQVTGNSTDPGKPRLKVGRLSDLGGPIRRLDQNSLGDHAAVSLAASAILASSPGGPSGLAITTPDGTRRIVGGADKTVRFYEAKDGKPTLPATAEHPEGVYREVAVFRMPEAVTNLQMTGDGTRLIIHLEGGSARVWDIRDPEERRKDLQAEWAERVPAGAYLDTLWASDTPDDNLRDAVINDASLTPLRRLVAAEMLEERLEDDRLAAEAAFEQMKQAAVPAGVTAGATPDTATPAPDPAAITSAVRAAAAAADLPARVKARVIALAAGWEYKKPEPSDAERLAKEMKQRKLAEARLVITKFAQEDAGGADEQVLKALDLGKARLSLEATLGRLHPEVLDALELEAVRTRDRLGEPQVAIALFTEAIERRAISRTAVDAVDLRLWSTRAYTHWLSSDLSACASDMRTVGSHLTAVWRSNPGANFSLMRSVGVFSFAGFADADEVGQLARKLSATTAQSLLREAVAQPSGMLIWRLDSLTRSNLALSALDRKSSSMSWVTVHSAVRHALSAADDATLAAAAEIDGKPGSLTGGKVLDREGHRAAAREALAKARALMAPAADGTPSPWANDQDAKALLAEAAALLEGQPGGPATPAKDDK